MYRKILAFVLALLLARTVHAAGLDGTYRGDAHGTDFTGLAVHWLDTFRFSNNDLLWIGTLQTAFFDVTGGSVTHPDYCWWIATPCAPGASLDYNLLWEGFHGGSDSCGDSSGFVFFQFQACNDGCGPATPGCSGEFINDMDSRVIISPSQGNTQFDYMLNEGRDGGPPLNMVGHAWQQ